MKGLFVKDFKLLKNQSQSFFLIAVIFISGGMALFSDDITFALGFPTFITSLIGLSTISYDDFDNGNAFLFTLPITRKGYVIEKYLFGLLLGCGAWIITILLVAVVGSIRNIMPFDEIVMISLMILPIILFLQSLMIPFQLKFGAEKGRIFILSVLGAIFLLGLIIAKVMEWSRGESSAYFVGVMVINVEGLIVLMNVVAFVVWLISMGISILVMNKKEF